MQDILMFQNKVAVITGGKQGIGSRRNGSFYLYRRRYDQTDDLSWG